MSINKIVGKQMIVYSENRILLNNKKEQITDTCKNLKGSLKT